MCMIPAKACAIQSKPVLCASGPVRPNADTEAMTSFGLISMSESKSQRRRYMTPGQKFSTTTSTLGTSCRINSSVSAWFRSMHTRTTLRCSTPVAEASSWLDSLLLFE